MAQNHQLLQAAITTGPGTTRQIPAELSQRSMVVSVTGTGTLSATVLIEVSNDQGTTWATRATFTLAGTAQVIDTDVDSPSPFPLVRGNVTALAGTNATVNLAMCAA